MSAEQYTYAAENQIKTELYLILILFSPLHFCRGIGQVLWTFIKFMFHGVDGMTAAKKRAVITVCDLYVKFVEREVRCY